MCFSVLWYCVSYFLKTVSVQFCEDVTEIIDEMDGVALIFFKGILFHGK